MQQLLPKVIIKNTCTITQLKDIQLTEQIILNKMKVVTRERGEDKCRVCGIVHESQEDIDTDSKWMGCYFKVLKSKDKWKDCKYGYMRSA